MIIGSLRGIIVAACILCLTGCGGWQTKTRTVLRTSFETTKMVDGIANTYMHKQCMEIAAKCGQLTPGVCPALKECQATKHVIENATIVIYNGIAAGLLAVELDEQNTADEKYAKAKEMLYKVRDLLSKAGVF